MSAGFVLGDAQLPESGGPRAAVLPGSYLLLVDYTSRLCRQGKARVSREVAAILERLATSADIWGRRIRQLLGKTPLLRSYFPTDRQRLRELARERGVHHLDSLAATTA